MFLVKSVNALPRMLWRWDMADGGVQALEVGSIAHRNLFFLSSRELSPLRTRGYLSSCHPIDPLNAH